ncbi:MAG: DUF1573 domain-containing protein [Draconibacterium sp.]|nr:DUF1573 domain-containing protein [Draconibacterium sp.]
MNRFLFVIFIFTLFSCSPQKKGNQKKINADIPEKLTGITEITFNEEIHDFGQLISGEIVVATFVFTNSGKHNLVIEKVESDCGCVYVDFTKEPVEPGKTGLIEVEFDSSGMFGKQFKTIEIGANSKEPKHLAIFAIIINEQLEIKY